MHELSIATSLVETAVRTAAAHRAVRVTRLRLLLGSLAGVQQSALEFSFPIAARGTLCEGAVLEIVPVPARGTCPRCRTVADVDDLMAPCASCGDWPLEVAGGREMTLDSLEVD